MLTYLGECQRKIMYFTSEVVARIKESQQEIKDGKSVVLMTKEELNTFFESL